jgi:hypothetical protein
MERPVDCVHQVKNEIGRAGVKFNYRGGVLRDSTDVMFLLFCGRRGEIVPR